MATEFWQFAVVTNPGVTVANPQVTNIPTPPRKVVSVRVRIPPGPRGNLGFAIGAAGQQLLPQQSGLFILADDEVIEFPLSVAIDSGAWQCFTINGGNFIHTIYVGFFLDLVDSQRVVVQSPAAVLTGQVVS